MQTRVIINLVNGNTLRGDWTSLNREEFNKILEEEIIPNMPANIYFSIFVKGIKRIVHPNAVSDLYIEERDETKL
jgi:hypothetical protein